MFLFSSLSIKSKIRLMLILISTTALLIASAAFIVQNLQVIKQDTLQNINTLASVIEKDIGAALAFNDEETAEDTLSALAVHKDVLRVCIFDNQKTLFAGYRRHQGVTECDYQKTSAGFIWSKRYIDVVKSIKFDNEDYGTLVFHYSLDTIINQFKTEVIITGVILAVSLFFVFLLSFLLDKFITAPILDLKKTAIRITGKKDYAVRAEKKYTDEVGELVDGFNLMLDEIQTRDAKLKNQNELLEKKVHERTVLLQKKKEELEQKNQLLTKAVEKAEELTESATKANQYKSQFIASMSHEIRTPMNAILGFTELLEESLTNKKQAAYLKSISIAGKTLLNLINEILDLSKIEAGKFKLEYKDVNLFKLFHETRQIFSKQTQDKGIDFILTLDPHLPEYLILDGARLRQVIFNLVGNAVKFTNRGKIELRVGGFRGENSGKLDLMVQVQDTGIGIEPDQQEIVFKAFQQHKNQSQEQYGGTGLGLAISKRLVKIMNGSISLESAPGRGSLFTITFRDIKIACIKTSSDFKKEDTSAKVTFENPGLAIIYGTTTTPEIKRKLSGFIKTYETSLAVRIKEIQQVMLISDITKFAEEIKEIGDENGFDFLVNWSNHCLECVDCFDSKKTIAALHGFTDFINDLKTILEQSDETKT